MAALAAPRRPNGLRVPGAPDGGEWPSFSSAFGERPSYNASAAGERTTTGSVTSRITASAGAEAKRRRSITDTLLGRKKAPPGGSSETSSAASLLSPVPILPSAPGPRKQRQLTTRWGELIDPGDDNGALGLPVVQVKITESATMPVSLPAVGATPRGGQPVAEQEFSQRSRETQLPARRKFSHLGGSGAMIVERSCNSKSIDIAALEQRPKSSLSGFGDLLGSETEDEEEEADDKEDEDEGDEDSASSKGLAPPRINATVTDEAEDMPLVLPRVNPAPREQEEAPSPKPIANSQPAAQWTVAKQGIRRLRGLPGQGSAAVGGTGMRSMGAGDVSIASVQKERHTFSTLGAGDCRTSHKLERPSLTGVRRMSTNPKLGDATSSGAASSGAALAIPTASASGAAGFRATAAAGLAMSRPPRVRRTATGDLDDRNGPGTPASVASAADSRASPARGSRRASVHAAVASMAASSGEGVAQGRLLRPRSDAQVVQGEAAGAQVEDEAAESAFARSPDDEPPTLEETPERRDQLCQAMNKLGRFLGKEEPDKDSATSLESSLSPNKATSNSYESVASTLQAKVQSLRGASNGLLSQHRQDVSQSKRRYRQEMSLLKGIARDEGVQGIAVEEDRNSDEESDIIDSDDDWEPLRILQSAA